ncbi:pilus assembly protein TadG-related protein [Methylobacterium radiodurans]|nr:pilus assembly protein TadG-related protein [Methylobacterium radiodurans]
MLSPRTRPGRLTRALGRLRERIAAAPARRLAGDRHGNVIVIFALSALPLIGSVGAGVEYLRKVNYRARLDDAADAAAMAAITTARDYISSNPSNQADPTADAIARGKARAEAVFRANAASTLGALSVTPTITLARNGQDLTASAGYSTTFPSPFGRLLGNVAASSLNVVGTSTANLSLPTYVDFYLLLDTSGSMGLPTSAAQQVSFAKQNPDMADSKGNNCAFACHFPSFKGYDLSKTYNIELRIATVGKAVAQLIDTAKSKATLDKQYRIGLFPFINDMETAADLTQSLDNLKPYANNLEAYMDVGDSTRPRGSGGTHFERVMPAMNSKIASVGDGSTSAKAKPFVFLVTDGMANTQYYYGKANAYDWTKWTGSYSNLIDPSLCTQMKNRGITISILYIPYLPMAQPFNDNVGYENVRVNSLIPNVPTALQSCASTGFFRTANDATQITTALNAMFEDAIKAARLTQ